MKDYALYVFDLDGVLYRGDQAIDGAAETVAEIRRRGKQVRFLTNNSTETRSARASQLTKMGIRATEAEVMTSAYGAGISLRGSSAFVVGEDGLREELANLDVKLVKNDEAADWVVVGLCRDLRYADLDDAQARIRGGSCFMATNRDATFPDAGGRIRPGAGAIVAALCECVGRQPDTVIGKPEPFLLELILKETGAQPAETLVVGDRPDTDLLCAQRAGCDSVLVLTGVSDGTEPAIHGFSNVIVIEGVGSLFNGNR